MCDNNTRELAEYLGNTKLMSKNAILKALQEAQERISRKAESDKHHSAAYYHALEKLIRQFTDEVKKTVLFEKLEDCWFYDLYITYSGIRLFLEHAVAYNQRCGDHPNYGIDQRFVLISKSTRLLSVEEYAREYSVETVTVRQWIRRGKIRNAIKRGREWYIPELTEIPSRGYKSALYMWYEYLYDLPEEYAFLTQYTSVIINQSRKDKSKYEVVFSAGGIKPVIKEYDTKSREKLELFLISDPRIHYTENALDEPQNVVFDIYK